MKRFGMISLVMATGCGHAGTMASDLTIVMRDQNGSPLADAVIFALPLHNAPQSQPVKHTVEQVNKKFVPFVTAVPVNSVVTFPNHDREKHHVYSFSAPKTFEIRLYKGTDSPPVTLDKPGVVTLGCNIHDWMVGYIYILETPFYGISNAEGAVSIGALPDGEYHLKAWHPGMPSHTEAELQTLHIQNQPELSLNYSINVRPEAFWKPQADEWNEYGF